MVDINAIRPFPLVVFPERVVIVTFLSQNSDRIFFLTKVMIGPNGAQMVTSVAGKDRQAMADPEGADDFSVVMDMFDEFDSFLRGQANGLGMEWPFDNMAQVFSKLWERSMTLLVFAFHSERQLVFNQTMVSFPVSEYLARCVLMVCPRIG
jgi:hypothetical protein